MFSGKEATLNRVILLILYSDKLLAKYDVFLKIRKIKGYRRMDARTVYRRMDALEKEDWIVQNGKRPAKPGWPSELYEITLKGIAALKIDEKSIEDFLNTATDRQLLKFIGAFT